MMNPSAGHSLWRLDGTDASIGPAVSTDRRKPFSSRHDHHSPTTHPINHPINSMRANRCTVAQPNRYASGLRPS